MKDRSTELRDAVQDAAKEVFQELGSGHPEVVYETALELELRLRDTVGPILRQVPCPIRYKGHTVGVGFIDMLLDDVVVVELKAVAKLSGRDETQVVKYLAGVRLNTGLLINFNQVSGEVDAVELSRANDSKREAEDVKGPVRQLQFGSEVSATACNTFSATTTSVIGFGNTWLTDPPDSSLVGVPLPSLPPTLSGGQALDLPEDSSELI